MARSFRNKLNRVGERLSPCFTPLLISNQSVNSSFKIIHDELSLYNDLNYFSTRSLKALLFSGSCIWQTNSMIGKEDLHVKFFQTFWYKDWKWIYAHLFFISEVSTEICITKYTFSVFLCVLFILNHQTYDLMIQNDIWYFDTNGDGRIVAQDNWDSWSQHKLCET